jgi:hypothetical protein
MFDQCGSKNPVEAPPMKAYLIITFNYNTSLYPEYGWVVSVPVPLFPVVGISLEDLKNINPYDIVPTCD